MLDGATSPLPQNWRDKSPSSTPLLPCPQAKGSRGTTPISSALVAAAVVVRSPAVAIATPAALGFVVTGAALPAARGGVSDRTCLVTAAAMAAAAAAMAAVADVGTAANPTGRCQSPPALQRHRWRRVIVPHQHEAVRTDRDELRAVRPREHDVRRLHVALEPTQYAALRLGGQAQVEHEDLRGGRGASEVRLE